MLNRTIVAAFLATSAAAFGVASAYADGPRGKLAQPVSEPSERGSARPLGTVDLPPPGEGKSELPRTVRA